jgi:hypothetical protein
MPASPSAVVAKPVSCGGTLAPLYGSKAALASSNAATKNLEMLPVVGMKAAYRDCMTAEKVGPAIIPSDVVLAVVHGPTPLDGKTAAVISDATQSKNTAEFVAGEHATIRVADAAKALGVESNSVLESYESFSIEPPPPTISALSPAAVMVAPARVVPKSRCTHELALRPSWESRETKYRESFTPVAEGSAITVPSEVMDMRVHTGRAPQSQLPLSEGVARTRSSRALHGSADCFSSDGVA